MPDLLLELFSEEIPARMQRDAENHLGSALQRGLHERGYSLSTQGQQLITQTFVTPRRLAVAMRDIPHTQADITIERKGPKTNAPQAAIDGFLRSTGLSLAQLEKRMVGKDECYFAFTEQKGRPTAEVLKELIEEILATFPWPKSMRWGDHDIRWVRPLHNILCLFGNSVIPVTFGPLTANNSTKGHRFLSPGEIKFENGKISAPEYRHKLNEAYVEADFFSRKEIILKQIHQLAAAKNCTIVEDEKLLDEVTGLVEWPVALLGSIDAEYMELPREVLVSVMRTHQKYFALEDKAGKLAPHFITIANRFTADNGQAIISGNERVLRARFADGKFFWDQDRKKKLEDWAEGLKDVTYHAKLGTIADKVERITALAEKLADYVPGADKTKVNRAARLCKADLVTGMVGEFAELQGIMGRYYALHQGEDKEVADAIRDHYKPQGANDSTPNNPVSICIALADKLDTLVGMFIIGEKPTGSKDPYALRRAALGIVKIILANNIKIHIKFALSAACINLEKYRLAPIAKDLAKAIGKLTEEAILKGQSISIEDNLVTPNNDAQQSNINDTTNELAIFLADRLEVILREEGIAHDRIKAVFATGEDDLVRLTARTRALQQFLSSEDGANLLAAYKRASNILKIEEKKDNLPYRAADLNRNILSESEELALSQALDTANAALKPLLTQEKFIEAMTELARLRPSVDAFFEKILVNAPDPNTRANRLRLLAQIRETMDAIADFSKIEG